MAHQNSLVTKIVQVRPGLFHIYTVNGGTHWAGVKVVADLLGRSINETLRLSVKVC